MKKFLAVFLSLLMVFSVFSLAVYAEPENTPNNVEDVIDPYSNDEERTTRDIQNSEGLVVPINFFQLKSSVIFKFFEKIIQFILKLFLGDKAPDFDQSIADDVSSVAEEVQSAIEEGSQFLDGEAA